MLKMKMNHLHCSTPVFFVLLWPCVVQTAPCLMGQAQACVCLHCPAGQEPSSECSEVECPDTEVNCHSCPPGTFSNSHGPDQCIVHTQCRSLNRRLLMLGTSESDAVCGACLPGFSPALKTRSSNTQHSCMRISLVRLRRNAGKGARTGGAGSGGAGVGRANSTAVHAAEEKTTEYAVFALVPVFCVMGLLGILICNLLKKKGYKCAAEKETAEREAGMLQKDGNTGLYVIEDQNEDTISALVRLITEKKENAAALEELLLEYEKKQTSSSKRSSIKFPGFLQFRSLPRTCNHHHLHTINGLALHSGLGCSRCSQKKWPQVLLPLTIDTNKTSCATSIPSTPGEGRVLNVGRFQVAQILEGDPVSVATTPAESSDIDSIDSTNMESAEELSLLGTCSSSNSHSSKNRKDSLSLDE
ncbi:tumor necrosis factor receptor superfamily member 19L [Tachysurus fulvidraco]|uniref:tumor necrosis factor receptor superfamily member 19L n=1 Tax=Tachysurus fulvidraco TaxID=1234273 RepID=UPI001FEEF3B5|nr:tumor necrosis factor receptor superfamily member 19L [Tachysurus fulvidraco]XP_047678727.1 tumor necrosis factor receptor superfamily member 19L [Tachysurus fulvidraco]